MNAKTELVYDATNSPYLVRTRLYWALSFPVDILLLFLLLVLFYVPAYKHKGPPAPRFSTTVL
jgi:hypothetical protein